MNHKIILGVLAIVLLAGAAYGFYSTQERGQQCTLEAKICPDGSAVGRTGPNCEFAACPKEENDNDPGNSDGNQGILPYNSGVRGTVEVGPVCPVEQVPQDPDCADRPYQTLVTIFRANDLTHAYVLTQSGADGKFSASLPPGEYVLGAGETALPDCDNPRVSVGPEGYTSVTISCDSGIR